MTSDEADLMLRLAETLAQYVQRDERRLADEECGCSSTRGRCRLHNSIDYGRRLINEARVVADRMLHPERKSA